MHEIPKQSNKKQTYTYLLDNWQTIKKAHFMTTFAFMPTYLNGLLKNLRMLKLCNCNLPGD